MDDGGDVGGSQHRGVPLVFAGGYVERDGQVGYLQITNLTAPSASPSRTFHHLVAPVEQLHFFVAGSGSPHVSKTDIELALAQEYVHPRSWSENAGLLAGIVRRTASRDPTKRVSPSSFTSYKVHGRDGVSGCVHVKAGEPAIPINISMVSGGIDFTDMTRQSLELRRRYRAGESNPQLDVAELERAQTPRK